MVKGQITPHFTHFFCTGEFSLQLSQLTELTAINLSFVVEFFNQRFSL